MTRRCGNCGESMPNDALLCDAAGGKVSEIFTRLPDPDKFRLAALRATKSRRPQELAPCRRTVRCERACFVESALRPIVP
jgi:hypothetical protein